MNAGKLKTGDKTETKQKRIPIAAAKRMAQEYGYDMVAIHGFSEDFSSGWVATYGRTKELCRKIAKWTKGEAC